MSLISSALFLNVAGKILNNFDLDYVDYCWGMNIAEIEEACFVFVLGYHNWDSLLRTGSSMLVASAFQFLFSIVTFLVYAVLFINNNKEMKKDFLKYSIIYGLLLFLWLVFSYLGHF